MKDVREAAMIQRTSTGKLVRRPLSPHLQVYRPQITSVLSILHRATGIAVSAGTLLLVWWLVALATSDAAFGTVQGFIGSPIGYLLLFAWTVSLFFHLFAGIRHLAWDAGYGFEIRTVHVTGWIVVIATAVLTVLAWALGLALR